METTAGRHTYVPIRHYKFSIMVKRYSKQHGHSWMFGAIFTTNYHIT